VRITGFAERKETAGVDAKAKVDLAQLRPVTSSRRARSTFSSLERVGAGRRTLASVRLRLVAGMTKHAEREFNELDRFLDRCRAALAAAYRAAACGGLDPEEALHRSVRLVIRSLAVLIAAARISPNRSAARSITSAADALYRWVDGSRVDGFREIFERSCRAAYDRSGLGIFDADGLSVCSDAFTDFAEALLRPADNSTIDRLFFQTVPVWWLGCAFESMLALRPSGHPGTLHMEQRRRRRRGVYFTPPSIVEYVTCAVLERLMRDRHARLDDSEGDGVLQFRILDPAMGGGVFLERVVDYLGETAGGNGRGRIAAECVYGVDIDPTAVEIARFAVWAASGYADGISDRLNAHLVCGDALAGGIPCPSCGNAGQTEVAFDAVVGNPPYIASKNRLLGAHGGGQSDSYLMFLSAVVERGLVRPGGILSMVLPDPMLVRDNAAAVRCKLVRDWTLESLLHIFGAFPDAVVANVVPVFRNAAPVSDTFEVVRIERASDRRSFALDPWTTARKLARPVRRRIVLAQERCQLVYQLEDGAFGGIVRRIHGPDLSLADYRPPFAPLGSLNVAAIYRGEELGKSAITSRKGDLRILLGGESVQPYEIVWEGRRIPSERVRKPLSRYCRTKVLIQKSAGRVIAALDEVRRRHRGYVFPQSVYAVELKPDGMDHLYLLCILNSEVMNEYVRRRVTAYKMVQPQLEIKDIRALPIRQINFTTAPGRRAREVSRAAALFEDECLRAAEGTHFPELANFVGRCLTANPEMSDVVHDILVRLGRLAVDLTRISRTAPDALVTHRLECVRAAIEAVVRKLYSTDPAQMALAF